MKYDFNKKTFVELDLDPNKLAISGSNNSYSWQEFHDKVYELIEILEREGLNRVYNPVLIYGHKSADMVVAIYACMTLNIPYIPIDSIYPDDRVRKIIQSASCNLIINTSGEDLSQFSLSEICLDKTICCRLKTKPFELLRTNQLDLVYIIFTSGSTGEPKGVQISNEAVISFTKWMSSSDYDFFLV